MWDSCSAPCHHSLPLKSALLYKKSVLKNRPASCKVLLLQWLSQVTRVRMVLGVADCPQTPSITVCNFLSVLTPACCWELTCSLKKELLVVYTSLTSCLPLGFSTPAYTSSQARALGRRVWPFRLCPCARRHCFTKSVLQHSSIVTAWERNKVKTVVKVTSLSSLVFYIKALDCCLHVVKRLGRSVWHELAHSDCQL